MISQLAKDVREQTETFAELKNRVAQSDAVRAVFQLLTDLHTELQQWTSVFPAIKPHIPSSAADSLRHDVTLVRRQLVDCYERFAQGEYQQASTLSQIKNKVTRLRNSTKEAWVEYARGELGHYPELVSIAEKLPKMESHIEAIKGQLVTAQKHAAELPTDPRSVHQFHAQLKRLDARLHDLEGLPSDVRAFLDKLMRGEATFADVNQTVFDWCRAEGLAHKLRIGRL